MISKEFCTRLGGKITVRSKLGVGTVFSFTINPNGVRNVYSFPNLRHMQSTPKRDMQPLFTSTSLQRQANSGSRVPQRVRSTTHLDRVVLEQQRQIRSNNPAPLLSP